jgi:sigma-B regulation protein RsbU (phosphoserine phosphatase)
MNSSLILSTLNLALGGLVFLLGFVILRENPAQRLNRVVALMLFFGGIGAVLAATAFLASVARGAEAGGAGGDLLQNVAYVWEFYFPTIFLFANIFPYERAWVRRPPWRPRGLWTPGFVALIFAPHVFHFALMLVLSVWKPVITVPETGLLHYLAPLASVIELVIQLFLLVHQGLFSLVNLGFGIAAMLILFGSLRRARVPRLRMQLQVIAVGLSASLALYVMATSIPTLFNFVIPETLRSGLTIAALTLGPGSIAYSIVRYKFLDTKLLARRGILYALTSAVLVGFYLVVVGQLNQVLARRTGLDARVFEPVFLVVALALFHPIVVKLEESLDQIFMKDPADYRNVLRQLGRDLQTTIDLETLLSRTITTLADALLARRSAIVVFVPGNPIVRWAGESPGAEVEGRMAALVAGVGDARGDTLRLSDRIDGLDPEAQQFLSTGLGLSLLVPLHWRDERVGMILLGEKMLGTEYTSEDAQLLTTLAAQVSVSLQNALLMRDRLQVARIEEEMNLAREIQRNSLLSTFPAMPRCEVHALYIPSRHVGGDFYDVVEAADGSHLVAIGDVSGKGMPAALLSAMLHASLRTQARSVASLPEILRNINALLYQSTGSHQFATFFLARIDGERLRLWFSNAGHNWPVIVRKTGERLLLEEGGTILGILESVEYREAQVALVPGDVIVLYTDGISEATNAAGELFGEDRLYGLLHALPPGLCAEAVADRLLAAVRGHLAGVDAQDDITLVVVRVTEPSGAELRSVPVPEAVETV